MKQFIVDAMTGELTENEIPDIPLEPQPEEPPTLEERVKATEDAILMLMDMGV